MLFSAERRFGLCKQTFSKKSQRIFLCLNNKQAPVTEIHCLGKFFTFIQHNKQVFLLSFCSKKKKKNPWQILIHCQNRFSSTKKSSETFLCFSTSAEQGRWAILHFWHICVAFLIFKIYYFILCWQLSFLSLNIL